MTRLVCIRCGKEWHGSSQCKWPVDEVACLTKFRQHQQTFSNAQGQTMNTDEYEERMTRLVIAPKGEPIFSEQATTVEIDDESGGEFVVISQHLGDYGKIAIDPTEWPAIRAAVDKMIGLCRS